jgi:hypothetical protein
LYSAFLFPKQRTLNYKRVAVGHYIWPSRTATLLFNIIRTKRFKKFKIMKIKLGIIAILLFGSSLVSCTKTSLSEEDQFYENATDGDEGHEDDRSDD